MDKNEFIRACRDGGNSIEYALRALDRAYFPLLYRDGVRALRDADAARDLVQETFIRVWQRCATYRGESELFPWIKTIFRNAALDRLRRPERERPLEEGEADGPVDPAIPWPPSPDDEARRRERDACFKRCWRKFEEACPAHAAVMGWIVEDGLGNEEISQLLGRTPGATREFVSQCRKRARVHLAEWYALSFGGR